MNIPQSVIEPFGVIGIPTLEPVMPSEVVLYIKKSLRDWMEEHIKMGYGMDINIVRRQLQEVAVACGADWASSKAQNLYATREPYARHVYTISFGLVRTAKQYTCYLSDKK